MEQRNEIDPLIRLQVERVLYTRSVAMCNAEIIAKYSFECHPTVSYLDLNIGDYTKFQRQLFWKEPISYKHICTEQQVQTSIQSIFAIEETSLLQRHHLDLPRRRMCIDEKIGINSNRIFDCINSYAIIANKWFYHRNLCQFVIRALENNGDEEKIIKNCLRLINHKMYPNPDLCELMTAVFKILKTKISDSELIVDTLKLCQFEFWIIVQSTPEQLEFCLQHAHTIKRARELFISDIMTYCIIRSRYEHVRILLKYQDFPKMEQITYKYALERINRKRRNIDTRRLLFDESYSFGNMRRFLAILLLYAFVEANRPASEMMKLLWRSLPDSFFTLEEFQSVYHYTLTESGLRQIYRFYTDTIGKKVTESQPRMLEHYCRVKIREVLSVNESLFNGIDKLDLPVTLQQYLKLQV